jgi:hypothetical protein
MRKRAITYTSIVFLISYCISCDSASEESDLHLRKLDYPSASAVEYYNGQLFVMGDDAPNLLVLDTNLAIVDSIPIVSFAGKRIPKDTKPDLESSIVYSSNNETMIFFFGSGSLDPYRNTGWKYQLNSKTKDNIYLQHLNSRIKTAGIAQINIEGACYLPGKLLLVNRGNKSYPNNQLITIDESFLRNDSVYQIQNTPFGKQKDTALFKGISGLCYSGDSDKLILTVSTEDTRSSYDDGAIGKSYLWIINNISTKLTDKTIKPNRLIDLEYFDERFKGQKIESATIIKETDKLFYLALVADNDDGSSTVFKMSIRKTTSHGE